MQFGLTVLCRSIAFASTAVEMGGTFTRASGKERSSVWNRSMGSWGEPNRRWGTEPDLQGVKTAVGAGRILLHNGKLSDVGSANQPRHPRSIMGWNKQYLHLIVIDGRQPNVSIGLSYPEMAALAKQYTCTDAIELDGGGSSTLWAMGKILNSPSDGKPRAIANGLILFRRDYSGI